MVQILPAIERTRKPTFSEKIGLNDIARNFGEGLSEFRTKRLVEEKIKNETDLENAAVLRLTGKNITGLKDPKMRQPYVQMALEKENKESEFGNKIRSDQNKKQDELQKNQEIIDDLEERRGLPKGSLKSYVNDPKMAEQVTREKKDLASNQPISPEQQILMKEVRLQPGFENLDEIGQYRAYTDAGVSPINAERESKLKGSQLQRKQQEVDKSYSNQKDFIDQTTNRFNAFETETKPKLTAMQALNEKDLISPTQEMFLDALGIPLGALDNPNSELYQKLSQDLLKGLPETYGSRILKVEVDNFLKTIPTLSNSAEGRRMIASSLLKLGEMKEAYYREMRKQQNEIETSGSSYPRDFQQKVLENVLPQLTKINHEFQQVSQLTSIPKGTRPFFNPQGTISFVTDTPENIEWATRNGGRRVW